MSAATMHMEPQQTDTSARTLPLLAGVLALSLAAAGLVWWWENLHWPIDVVRIEGTVAHADRDQLKTVVASHTRAGFFGMDLGVMRADLRALPWVRDASLRRVWPDTLYVDVQEHQAAAGWNENALISRAGMVFEPDAIGVGQLPALEGPDGLGPAMLERLRAFEHQLEPLGLRVVAIHQDARRAWRLTFDNGMELRLGRESIDERFRRFVTVWPGALEPRAERIATVDLRYTNGFAVAWREGEAAEDAREGGA